MCSDIEKGRERGEDQENGTICTESTYPSDTEKAEANNMESGAVGTPDLDHEEVVQMDEGHLGDLARPHVSPPTPPHSHIDFNFYRLQHLSKQALKSASTAARFHELTPNPAPKANCHG